MYSITENIYYSQLSSVAILLQPEPNCFTSYNTRKGLCSLSLCAVVLRFPPQCHADKISEARSYFASTVLASSTTSVHAVGGERFREIRVGGNIMFSGYKEIAKQIRVAARFCGCLMVRIAGSNPAEGVCLYVVLCVCRGLCDRLITRPEESYHAFNCV
jgi:hypothetical protein